MRWWDGGKRRGRRFRAEADAIAFERTLGLQNGTAGRATDAETAGVLVFSRETEDLAGRDRRLPGAARGPPRTLVWDRQAGIHGHGSRPSEAFAAFCGQLRVDWRFCEQADPHAKSVVERLQGYAETNFEPGRRFANELDFEDQLGAWFVKVNARRRSTLRALPVDRLCEELEAMAALPPEMPDTARRWLTRVPPDPHLRFDTNYYSLDPAPVGRRVEVSVDQQQLTAVALDTGELACRHATGRSPRTSTPAR